METKFCSGCQKERPKSAFALRSDRPCGIQGRCKDCHNRFHRERRKANVEIYRAYGMREHLKNNYGLTIEMRKKMSAIQDHKCLGCGKLESSQRRALDVDHCHNTGKIRGLLCPSCNLTLGYAKDNPTILRSLATYLESHT